MKKYTHVLWDFNGTILDDVQIGIEAVNEMLVARGLSPIACAQDYRTVFGFPVKAYYERLGLDTVREDFDTVLAPLWVSLYQKREPSAMLYPQAKEVTSALRAAGVVQCILSATERKMLFAQLRARGAQDWFDEIWGNDSIHAYGKERLAAAWRAEHPNARAVLVGDTTHDYEVARTIGADCILVASGHHDAQRLHACGVPVVQTLAESLSYLLS